MADQTTRATSCCCTRIAIDRSIITTTIVGDRLRSNGAYWRLEPCAGKLARTVLRGEWRSNALFLPGDWALPILAFASELERQGSCSAGFLQLARDTAKCWHPDRFSAFTGDAVEENASTILRTRKAYIAAIGEFCVTSAWGDWAEWVPEGKVGVIARQVERVDHLGRPNYGEAEVCALIAKDLYAARGEVAALRDTAHEIIPMSEALRPKRVG